MTEDHPLESTIELPAMFLNENAQVLHSSSDSSLPSNSHTSVDSSSLPEDSASSSMCSDTDNPDPDATPTCSTNSLPTFKLVGDNLDKTIRPRDIRHDHQTRSLHYFHLCAVRDRVDLSKTCDTRPIPEDTITLTEILPTKQDQECLLQNFAILISRVLKERLPFFKRFGQSIERHIHHEEYNAMSQKSEVVSTFEDVIECVYNIPYYCSYLPSHAII